MISNRCQTWRHRNIIKQIFIRNLYNFKLMKFIYMYIIFTPINFFILFFLEFFYLIFICKNTKSDFFIWKFKKYFNNKISGCLLSELLKNSLWEEQEIV